MGQQSSSTTKTKKKKSLQQQARIENLYEITAESIRLESLVRTQSLIENGEDKQVQSKIKQKKKKKQEEKDEQLLQELLYPFSERTEFSWGEEITELFKKYFGKGFEGKWQESKEFFYELLLENLGMRAEQVQNSRIGAFRHINNKSKLKGIKESNLSQSFQKVTNQRKNSTQQTRHQSFQEQFMSVIKQRNSLHIKGSFAMNEELIDRRRESEIAEVEFSRLTVEEEINEINCSIIDGEVEDKGEVERNGEDNDDEYFLPLITKRYKNKNSSKKLSQQVTNQINSFHHQRQIEMSHMPSEIKYSKIRLESASVILPATIFYERMNFSTKVETDQALKIYRQLSNTIQQTINSCNIMSCPLKHFLLYFQYKTSRKKISQLGHSGSVSRLKTDVGSDEVIPKENGRLKGSSQFVSFTTTDLKKQHSVSQLPSQRISHLLPIPSISPSDITQLLLTISPKSQIIRKKREFNTNFLLKQIKQFSQSYTQFLYCYLKFLRIQETELSTFVNLDTVYGVVLRNLWNIVAWIADRGYEWEEYALRELCERESAGFEVFVEDELEERPQIILELYAKFANKSPKKIKTQPQKLCKAYTSLLKLRNQVFPQKYLKKIIIFYRESTKCCQGADDLMTLYQFMLKNCIFQNFTQQMHLFRMKNIIQKLIPIQSSADGAGEIVYAWTTWNIVLEMLLLKLKEYKAVVLKELEERERTMIGGEGKGRGNHNTERKDQRQKEHGQQSLTQPRKQPNVPLRPQQKTQNPNRQVTQNTKQQSSRQLQFSFSAFDDMY